MARETSTETSRSGTGYRASPCETRCSRTAPRATPCENRRSGTRPCATPCEACRSGTRPCATPCEACRSRTSPCATSCAVCRSGTFFSSQRKRNSQLEKKISPTGKTFYLKGNKLNSPLLYHFNAANASLIRRIASTMFSSLVA